MNRKQKDDSTMKIFPCTATQTTAFKAAIELVTGEGDKGRKMPRNSLTDIQQFFPSRSNPLVVVFDYIPEFLKVDSESFSQLIFLSHFLSLPSPARVRPCAHRDRVWEFDTPLSYE